MNGRKVFNGVYDAHGFAEMRMSISVALEDLALGEVTLEEGAKTVRTALASLDAESAHDLYDALRSWLWKTLEARRRDDELSGWMDVISRASARLADESRELSIKLEGFMELLHASIMTAGAARHRDSLERKHVKDALRFIYQNRGRVARKQLMDTLKLKPANLSRVMTPLVDDGLVMREVEGREISYRLTMRGTEMTLPLVAHDTKDVTRADASQARKRDALAAIFPVIKKMPVWEGVDETFMPPAAMITDIEFCDDEDGYLGGAPWMRDESLELEQLFTKVSA
jgi:DNA-binding MarR family transcriptional regulator